MTATYLPETFSALRGLIADQTGSDPQALGPTDIFADTIPDTRNQFALVQRSREVFSVPLSIASLRALGADMTLGDLAALIDAQQTLAE